MTIMTVSWCVAETRHRGSTKAACCKWLGAYYRRQNTWKYVLLFVLENVWIGFTTYTRKRQTTKIQSCITGQQQRAEKGSGGHFTWNETPVIQWICTAWPSLLIYFQSLKLCRCNDCSDKHKCIFSHKPRT